ncbi:sigma-54 dependent transcriptional regulator [Rhodobacter sp. Har01]|uniref:sigma-54-dependent transcriptional regulator n=1 Tax=Rhodobacter sp. Har01 TaxID=2883999 RepID=UPI001D06B5AD|nr:sigma-54 dependent transcriptional regulator [Rhodobacter sp. Har01]MCB6178198.1 sigma-54 dependent transcriptional regulator [Rhodobacter sp. Har01]
MTPGRADPALVLAVGDLALPQAALRQSLAAAGFTLQLAATAEDARRLFRALTPRIVVLDLGLSAAGPLLAEMLQAKPDLAVLALAASEATDSGGATALAGARDLLLRPLDADRLLTALKTVCEAAPRPGARPPAERRKPAGDLASVPPERAAFIGSSEAMERVHRIIASVARSQATVFITGESGTGKELAALALHARSNRANGPFIALNCGAIPPDLLESEVFGHMKGSFTGAISDKPGAAAAADGGTLFLDEVCEMALPLQTKMLRFLQTSTIQPVGAVKPRRVDVRIVCATNRDPLEAVRRGHFREDLFYRLYVVPVHMPPLRDRGPDIIEIAEAALERFAAEEGKRFEGLAPETRAFLLTQDWPGNVRQLLNVMRNAVVLNDGGPVTPEMLPLAMAGTALNFDLPRDAETRPALVPVSEPGLSLAEIERRAIEAALARHDGSIPRAARELEVSPSTLYRKLDAWSNRR